MKVLYTLLILLIPFVGFGQDWQQSYETGDGNCIQETSDNGYIIIGSEDGGNWLIKINENGDLQWSNFFVTENICTSIQKVIQTSDGGFLLYGAIYNNITIPKSTDSDLLLIKTDENGNEEWTRTYEVSENYETRGYSFDLTSDGGIVLLGRIYNEDTQNDILIIKTDELGFEEWNKVIDINEHDLSFDIKQTNDNKLVVAGVSRTSNGDYPFILKTDDNGNELWVKSWFTDVDIEVQVSKLEITYDNGFIISGAKRGEIEIDSNGDETPWDDMYLIKTDENGNEEWVKTYGEDDIVKRGFFKQSTDGGYISTGQQNGGASVPISMFLTKTDNNGNEIWTNFFYKNQNEELLDSLGYNVTMFYSSGSDLIETYDGNIVLVGSTNDIFLEGDSYFIDSRIFVVKTTTQGNITSTFEIPLPNPNRKLEKTVNLIGQEIKSQTNTPIIEIYDDGTVEKKVIIE